MKLLDREPLFAQLRNLGLDPWAQSLRRQCCERFDRSHHGSLPHWIDAWHRLPEVPGATLDAQPDAVAVGAPQLSPDLDALRDTLMDFHPWRKGPFDLFGLKIDSEWRCDRKWNRLSGAIDLRGKSVLDVGCGNGYYGWKMLQAGALWVLGCDPMLLYVMQFEVLRRYASGPERHFVVPITDAELPARIEMFDVAFSMGVLYHRTSPIDHLQTLCGSLRAGGQLVLETLVIESDREEVLVPQDRYAKMRNVWFIPSLPMLNRWLERTGFVNATVVDVAATTTEEQRRTDWMTFQSLADFLDPADPAQTLEGYPAPRRAVITARKAVSREAAAAGPR